MFDPERGGQISLELTWTRALRAYCIFVGAGFRRIPKIDYRATPLVRRGLPPKRQLPRLRVPVWTRRSSTFPVPNSTGAWLSAPPGVLYIDVVGSEARGRR